MVLAEGSTPEEAVNLSLITRPLREGGLGGVDSARLDWDFRPEGRNMKLQKHHRLTSTNSLAQLEEEKRTEDVCPGFTVSKINISALKHYIKKIYLLA